MSGFTILFKELLGVCTNGKIPNLKLVSALMNCHKMKPIYHHSEPVMQWAPTAGGKLRMVGYHFRQLKDETKLQVCFKKAWGLYNKYIRVSK